MPSGPNQQVRAWRDGDVALHEGGVVDTVDGYEVIECRRCGFKHVIPIPSDRELEEYYQEKFYSVTKADYVERQKRDLRWWNMVFEERYRGFERLLPANRRRILDVGCGPGFFLHYGKQRGWNAYGVEPSRQAAECAKDLGVEVLNAPFSASVFQGTEPFDVVYSHGVLEHLRDPRALVRLGHGLLKPGGVFFVDVANDYNPLQLILRRHAGYRPWWLVPPQHLNYFDIPSLRTLLQSEGFEFVHVTTTFPIELFLLMGDNYVGDDQIGSAVHARRKSLEFALADSGSAALKQQLYESFAALGIGRQIEMTVRKR